MAALANVAFILLVTGPPGWRAVPFLTEETQQVIGLLVASLIAGAVENFVNFVLDIPWVKALGDIITTIFAVAVLTRLWRLFPFDFGNSDVDWALVARVVILMAIAGCVVGVVAELVVLFRSAAMTGRSAGHQS